MTIRGHPEDGAVIIGTALIGRAVETAIRALHQACQWGSAIIASGERVKRLNAPAGGEFEPGAGEPCATILGRTIESAVGRAHKPVRIGAVAGAREGIHG